MATVITSDKKTKTVIGGLTTTSGGEHNGRGHHFRGAGGPVVMNGRLGMALGLAAIAMMFLGFTSAYIVRHGLDSNWQPLALPPILWLSTAMIVGSSFTFETARRAQRRGSGSSYRPWFSATAILGLGFLLGQIAVWRQLSANGIYLDSTPHSSFFYVLTVTHAVHLLGGLVAMAYLLWHGRARAVEGPGHGDRHQRAVDVTALYWHFLAGLWIYLFLVLFVWR
jgi:cytochrome c oxidase subunit 3